MASGFPGGGGEAGFYGGVGGGGGRSIGPPVGSSLMGNINTGNNNNNLYRFQQQQLGGGLGDPGAQIGYRRPDFLMIGKRSLTEFQSSSLPPQSNLFQPQQQGLVGGGMFLRSVKQRSTGMNSNYQNHSLSPISTLSPSIDLCSPSNNLSQDHSSSLSTSSSARYGVPLYHHHHRHQIQQPNPVSSITHKPSNLVQPGPGLIPAPAQSYCLNPEVDNNSKIRTTLQELEKQLLDDDNDDRIGGGEGEGDAVSAITNSEWSETFQNLISPNPNPTITNSNNLASTTTANTPTNNYKNGNMITPSPTSSSSSSCSSSKTPPPPPPPPAPTPQPPPTAKPSQLISEVAAAIVDGKSEEYVETLSQLAQIASPTGEPEKRLAFYMHHALRSRLLPGKNPPPVIELYGSDHLASLHALYDLSPCFKLALLSSNLHILEAIASPTQENNGNGKKVVHIVDFDIGHGKQYMNLLRALVERVSQTLPSCSPLELKITAVETEKRSDKETSKRLEGVRDSLMKLVAEKGAARFSLRFNSVTLAVDELTRESLGCQADETLVANFAFRLYRVPDESVSMDNLRDEMLRRVRAMQPRVVTLAEQELNANTAPFAARVSECAAYYGTLLDSLGLTRDNPDRVRVEEAIGRKMSNAVACEGRERVERCEVFGKWRARMSMAGFKPKPVSRSVVESMRASLNNPNWGGNPNFTVKEENGGVCFGWMGRTLTVASAWR